MSQRRTKLDREEQAIQRTPKLASDKEPSRESGSRRTPHGEIFIAGSPVRESGIYEVLHDANHRSAHEVVMIANDLFPACDVCDNRVRYRVLRTAPYIFSDEDFEDPEN